MTRRGSFGPIVLLGLGAAGLAAVAGNKPLVRLTDDVRSAPGLTLSAVEAEARLPLAGALGLALLAGWGVLLVLRGRVRRGVAGLLALVAAGVGAVGAFGWGDLRSTYRDDARQALGLAANTPLGVNPTGWYFALFLAAFLAVVAAVLAVVLAPHWPEMGSKYDAPSAGGRPTAAPLGEQSSTDLWKSLDAGHDPTIESGTDPEPDGDPRA